MINELLNLPLMDKLLGIVALLVLWLCVRVIRTWSISRQRKHRIEKARKRSAELKEQKRQEDMLLGGDGWSSNPHDSGAWYKDRSKGLVKVR